jgi:hypothetical protein
VFTLGEGDGRRHTERIRPHTLFAAILIPPFVTLCPSAAIMESFEIRNRISGWKAELG